MPFIRYARSALLSTSALAMALSATPVSAEPERFVLDESHVSVGFLVGHARFADVLGQFTEVSGEFLYDSESQTLERGEVEIAADSVFTGHDERDGHVRGGDFLETGEYSAIRFKANRYEAESENTGTLHGDLTIRGITQPIRLEATINRRDDHPIGGADTLGASLRGSLMRSDYGMDYALEGDLVSDRIELIIEFEAVQQDG
ncbi:MAG: polyisoprenoid-binding protein [Spiribacter salinus]|uniref:Polyisoprenoid-binding protein n=1 Tax=Spiribacter salinus TaxID=1335746 RepID=A0A540VW90_9GAMM|nr:MAG: polyisoprenoid-binding protein [Spiribacter salinus]